MMAKFAVRNDRQKDFLIEEVWVDAVVIDRSLMDRWCLLKLKCRRRLTQRTSPLSSQYCRLPEFRIALCTSYVLPRVTSHEHYW